VALLAIGATVQIALKAADLLQAQDISAEVVNMRFVKPVDHDLLRDIAARFSRIVTVEDNTILGGFGSAVAETLAAEGITHVRLRMLGIQDRFVDHGTPQELAAEVGLDPAGITASVARFVAEGAPVVS
jgi:1-deoxy-D-xylulose-5-phosphate synthase